MSQRCYQMQCITTIDIVLGAVKVLRASSQNGWPHHLLGRPLGTDFFMMK
uniref:Uncharacterized protein n=1 Tax=Anguilla anguilla TaxID=7936 RepID=A0A0E9XYR8_ANGAN